MGSVKNRCCSKRQSSSAGRIAVLYSAFVPVPGRADEDASELAVEQAALETAGALAEAGFKPDLIPVATKLDDLFCVLLARRHKAVVNLCEGFCGHPGLEAHMAALLELTGIPFTGNPAHAMLICQNKFKAKALLAAAGVQTPQAWLAKALADVPASAHFPLIVKPNSEDASIGIDAKAIVKNRKELAARISYVLRRYKQPALVERFIDGREFNVGVLETKTRPRTLPLSEIPFTDFKPGEPRIVGYAAKWNERHRLYRITTPICPAHVTSSLAKQLNQTALMAWHALDLRGYGRIDFRVDNKGRAYVLEVNPNPDTSRDAGLVRAMTCAKITLPDFWRSQIEIALHRASRKRCSK